MTKTNVDKFAVENMPKMSCISTGSILLDIMSINIITTFLILSFGANFIESHGLGDQTVWQTGALLQDELGKKNEEDLDLAFKRDTNIDDEKIFVDGIKKIKVDVVAPNKELAQLMNSVSTKTNAKMLSDYKTYFEQNQIGSTSRPMLMTYFGLKTSTDEELMTWSKKLLDNGRKRENLIRGCDTVTKARKQSLEQVDGNELRTISEIRSRSSDENKLYLALLLFRNNLNLFLLENYSSLCARLSLASSGAQSSGFEFLL